MGQTYNVTARLKPINEKEAVEIILDFIEKNEGKKANFEVEEYRAKYGVDSGCELLLYRKTNNEVEDD